MGERVERPGALVASAVFAASVAALLLNDHVLKAAWPGFVTGKLSDVAGVAMVAIGLTALLRHRAVGFGLTAIAFALLKTVPVVAVLASPFLGGVTRTDPTDVGALVVLVPLWRWVGSRSAVLAFPRDRTARRGWVLPVQVALIGAAVFATTATSSDCGLAGASKVGLVGDSVVLLTPDGWFVSDDGGVVWRPDDFGEQFWPDDVELSDGFDPEQCVGEPRCVRVRRLPTGDGETLLVESEQDGDRMPILAIEPSDQRTLIELLEPEASGCSPVGDGSAVAVELADGDHTIVAMGEAGVLHQAPSGGWEWVAVGDYGFRPRQVDEEPFGIEVRSTLPSDTISRLVSPVVPLVVVLSPIVLLWWARRITRIAERNKRSAPGAAGTSIGVGIVLIVIGLGVVLLAGGFGNDVPPSIAAIWAGIIGAVVLGTWLYHRRPKRTIEAPPLPPLPPPPSDERVG